jgi:predicted nucleotide-binding protein
MARIDPRLLDKLVKKLGVTRRRVYALIEQAANTGRVQRHVGALILAGENGISYQRYATAEDMAELRGVPIERHSSPSLPQAAPIRGATKARVARAKPVKTTRNNTIFVVHGRDTKLNEDIFGFLRAIGINPKEWSHAIKEAEGANPNIGEVIHNIMKQVQGVLVMFSPDEEAKLKLKFSSEKDRKKGAHKLEAQSRPNVIFEAGLAMGAHAEKTILVQVGETREISDMAGRHMVHLSDDPNDRKELAQRLRDKLKFKIDTDGTSWLSEFKFNR